MPDALTIRTALPADIPALTVLIDAAMRHLGGRDYDARQVESGLRYVFGVDSRIIGDGTYFVVEDAEAPDRLAGCGGWSRRRTPFGGDHAVAQQDAGLRDPATDPAVIRAFYVHPDRARRGIGRRLLAHCEDAARAEGFTRFELVATLTGRPLYASCGYRPVESIDISLPDGIVLAGIRMHKP